MCLNVPEEADRLEREDQQSVEAEGLTVLIKPSLSASAESFSSDPSLLPFLPNSLPRLLTFRTISGDFEVADTSEKSRNYELVIVGLTFELFIKYS